MGNNNIGYVAHHHTYVRFQIHINKLRQLEQTLVTREILLFIFRSYYPDLVNLISQFNSKFNRSQLCKPVMETSIHS